MAIEKFSDIFIFLSKEKLNELLHDRKVLFAIISCIVAFILVIWLIIHFSFSGHNKSSPLDAIPKDASIILEIKQPKNLWTELSVNSSVWRELSTMEPFANISKDIHSLDSLFKTNDCATAIITDHPVYISFHTLPDNSHGFLYLTALTRSCTKKNIDEFIKQAATSRATITNRNFMGNDITMLSLPGRKETFNYVISKDVFICSYQLTLLENALKQQKSGSSITLESGFAKVSETAGKKVDANIYINYKYFPQFISAIISTEYGKNINELTGFAEWSALDVSVKKDVILLNGFTSVNGTTSFLSLFASQRSQEMQMINVIPSSTATFVHFGFSDFSKWYKLYAQYLDKKGKLKEHNARIADINTKYKTDIEKSYSTWIGKEMALVITEPSDSDITSGMFAVIKADNISNALTLLNGKPLSQKQHISSKSNAKNNKQKNIKGKNKDKHHIVKQTVAVETPVEVDGNKIYEYPVDGALSALVGDLFDGVEGKYFTVINDYVVFGNSPKALTSFLKEYADEKNLRNNSSYISFSNNISNESNIYLYSNIKKSLGIYLKYCSKGIYDYISNNLSLFKNFDAFAYQLKSGGKLFYSNICLKTYTSVNDESNALWAVKLDTTVSLRPQVITDNSDKSKKIIAFDNANNMYLVSKGGALLWKIKLKEKPLSNVFVIDYFKNGKNEYMFNTSNYIYLIDKDGKDVTGYPVQLIEASSAPMTVVDYVNDKDYRLIVPCGNNIYNYTKNGILNKGWSVVKTKNTILKEVTHLKLNGTDCLVTSDKDGNIYVVDKKGISRMVVKSPITVAAFSKFYLSNNKNRTNILTTDNSGNLVFISPSGVIEKKTIAQFSPNHYFIYEDFNNDKTYEYIFLDSNKLSVYNTSMKQVCSFTAPSEISLPPVFYKETGNKGIIGIVSANKIYLVKPDCAISEGFPIEGSNLFAIANLNNDGSLNLIVASDRILYNYSIK